MRGIPRFNKCRPSSRLYTYCIVWKHISILNNPEKRLRKARKALRKAPPFFYYNPNMRLDDYVRFVMIIEGPYRKYH